MRAHARTISISSSAPSASGIIQPKLIRCKTPISRITPCRSGLQSDQPLTATASAASATPPSVSQEPDSPSNEPATASPLSRIPPAKLKALRRQGLEMQDVIKLGRLKAGAGVVQQIRNRWKTSEVAKLYCGGKAGVNMKAIAENLEQETGGIVIHRSGGSVYLYRGDSGSDESPAE